MCGVSGFHGLRVRRVRGQRGLRGGLEVERESFGRPSRRN